MGNPNSIFRTRVTTCTGVVIMAFSARLVWSSPAHVFGLTMQLWDRGVHYRSPAMPKAEHGLLHDQNSGDLFPSLYCHRAHLLVSASRGGASVPRLCQEARVSSGMRAG